MAGGTKKPKDIITPLLQGGEKIVWCGRPEPEPDEMKLTIIETVCITALAILMASGIVIKCNGWLVLAFCGAAIIHTLYMVLCGTILPAKRSELFKTIVYALTDKRLLICDEKDGELRECYFGDISGLEIIDKDGTTGTISFNDARNSDDKIKRTDLLHLNCVKNAADVQLVLADFKRLASREGASDEADRADNQSKTKKKKNRK